MKASAFQTFTQVGFAARGVLYVLIAYMAIASGRNTGSSDVLRSMADGGASKLVLFVMALGLLAYGAWRCLEAGLDLEGEGSGAKGLAARAGQALSGVVHVLLGLLAAGLALGLASQGGGGGEGADKATGFVMELPGGDLLVRLLAIGFMLGGLAEGWRAYRLKFLEQLEPRAAARPWVRWTGRLGYIARGLVFILIGLLFWRAAGTHDPGQAGGVAEALGSLSGTTRTLVAAGLGLFGVFSFVQAVYRRIRDPRVLQRLQRA